MLSLYSDRKSFGPETSTDDICHHIDDIWYYVHFFTVYEENWGETDL